MRILGLLLMLATTAQAGTWALDVGLAGGIGLSRFAGEPAGQDPATFFFAPRVQAQGGSALQGQIGLDLSLSRKRRYSVSLQPSWAGQSLVLDERFDFGAGTTLKRQSAWEWQAFLLPLELAYSHPLWRDAKNAVLLRLGAGLWYAGVQGRRKTLRGESGDPLERPWAGPPDDWGPLAAVGLDWLSLPSGRRSATFELRLSRGQALQDPAAGAGLPVWGLQGVLAVPLWMRVI
jgi:hypothetical protein